MKPTFSQWQRLVAAARLAPEQLDSATPYGFSTRVVAKSPLYRQSGPFGEFVRFSWRALGMSALVMGATVAATFQPVMNRLADDAEALSDPVPEVEESGL